MEQPFATHYREIYAQIERAALIATDRGAKMAKERIRSAMQGAALGRLGNAIDYGSDERRGRGVHRTNDGGFSASGSVYIRTRSQRTLGAIESYTEGSEIRPVRGRWLWIATDDIPARAGRQRMTPELYVRNGFDKKIGPLVFARSASGTPLLIVKDVGLSAVGKPRSARALTKKGLPKSGQYAARAIVAFYGIPRTSRAARIDVRAIMESVRQELPRLLDEAMRGRRSGY